MLVWGGDRQQGVYSLRNAEAISFIRHSAGDWKQFPMRLNVNAPQRIDIIL
jgi:hypothetical protein